METKTDRNKNKNKNAIKVKCEHCGHVEVLDGLAAWFAIIMRYNICEKCHKKNYVQKMNEGR